MSTVISAICFTLISVVITQNLFPKAYNSFGPYNLSVVRFEECKGPKPHNSTRMLTNITEKGDDVIGHFNITYLEETQLEEVKLKIMIYSIKGNTTNLLWTYKIKELCRHFALGGLINVAFKVHNCIVDKGSYYFSQNFSELANIFLGSSFFYGDFLVKAIAFSRRENIVCLISLDRFTKKS